jgi:hypothetical protein
MKRQRRKHSSEFKREAVALVTEHGYSYADAGRSLIFSLHHARRLSKNLTCQFNNREYQVTGQGQGYRLRGAGVTL